MKHPEIKSSVSYQVPTGSLLNFIKWAYKSIFKRKDYQFALIPYIPYPWRYKRVYCNSVEEAITGVLYSGCILTHMEIYSSVDADKHEIDSALFRLEESGGVKRVREFEERLSECELEKPEEQRTNYRVYRLKRPFEKKK